MGKLRPEGDDYPAQVYPASKWQRKDSYPARVAPKLCSQLLSSSASQGRAGEGRTSSESRGGSLTFSPGWTGSASWFSKDNAVAGAPLDLFLSWAGQKSLSVLNPHESSVLSADFVSCSAQKAARFPVSARWADCPWRFPTSPIFSALFFLSQLPLSSPHSISFSLK